MKLLTIIISILLLLPVSSFAGKKMPTMPNVDGGKKETIDLAQFGLGDDADDTADEEEEKIEVDEEFQDDAAGATDKYTETDEEFYEEIIEDEPEGGIIPPPGGPSPLPNLPDIGYDDEDVDAGEDVAAVPKTITIDTVVNLDYQFFDTSDAFKVKYHINMTGTANIAAAKIKGSAEVATEVTGYLAKGTGGQCILDVSIAKVPYEITYNQIADDEADINIAFKKEITEKWESICTFIGGAKPFKTQGPTEKWISDALEKATPPISSIAAPLEVDESTTTTFIISEYTVIEEGLGSATIKGTGVITIAPKIKKE